MIVFKMTNDQWCKFRDLLITLSDEVDSKVCDDKVSEAFDDVWNIWIDMLQSETSSINDKWWMR